MAEPQLRRSRKGACVLGCMALPVVAGLVLFIVFTVNNAPVKLTIPPPKTPPVPNAFDTFVRAGKMAQLLVNKAPASMANPPTDRAGMKAAAEACAKEAAPILALVRQGLKQESLAPLQRSVQMIAFPDFASLRELERTLTGIILDYGLNQETFDAVRVMLDGAEVGVMVSKGGNMITALVADVCISIPLGGVDNCFSLLKSQQLDEVARRLDQMLGELPTSSEIVQEEGAGALTTFLELVSDPNTRGIVNSYQAAESMFRASSQSAPTFTVRRKAIGFALANKHQIAKQIQEYYRQCEVATSLPYSKALLIRAPTRVPTLVEGLWEKGWRRWESVRALLTLLRTQVALLIFQKQTGRFPATLSELVPKYLPALPDDPFGGAKGVGLVYRQERGGKGFSLYSRGPDMKDDGGQPTKYPGAEPGDMVAGKLWPRPAWLDR